MADYKGKQAVYAINSYVWKLLEANLGWERWKGIPPIIPVQQQPEIMQSGKAFMVYGSAIHPPTHLYQHKKSAVSYMIYAPSSTEVNNIVQLLSDVFERQDWAAHDVNDWLSTEAESRESGHRGVYFTTISSTMAEKAEDPADQEGGYSAGMVMLEMKYTTDPSTAVTSGFTV